MLASPQAEPKPKLRCYNPAMRRAIDAIAVSLIMLIFISCSPFVISSPPIWLEGQWELYDEDNIYIGECNIENGHIEVTMETLGYDKIDLVDMAYQEGGWSEESENTYILYLDYEGNTYCSFIYQVACVDIILTNGRYSAYFTLRK